MKATPYPSYQHTKSNKKTQSLAKASYKKWTAEKLKGQLTLEHFLSSRRLNISRHSLLQHVTTPWIRRKSRNTIWLANWFYVKTWQKQKQCIEVKVTESVTPFWEASQYIQDFNKKCPMHTKNCIERKCLVTIIYYTFPTLDTQIMHMYILYTIIKIQTIHKLWAHILMQNKSTITNRTNISK